VKLRQLTYFVAVADEGSFTRAAEHLLIAQPSLSQQIKALEEEVGGQLFERLPQGIRLTPAGKAFLQEARAAVSHADRARRAARTTLGLEAGELEVATVTSMAVGVLPMPFHRWHDDHPRVSLRLREYLHRRALEEAVRTGVGDIAVGPRPVQWIGPLVHLGWEEFVLVLPPGDPLARSRKPIPLDTLAERDWILFAKDHGLSELMEFVCARAGFMPKGRMHTGQVAAAPQLAAAGLGIALIPENIVPDGLETLVRRLKSPIVRQVVAFSRRDWSPLAEAFLDVLREQPWQTRPRQATVID
jgi:DNA-binding transcriptional LysR family regulator